MVQGGCERRIEVFVKKKIAAELVGVGLGVGFGGSGWM